MKNKRFRQADREAGIVLGMYGFFFLWWTFFAFGLGGGDPEHYSYVFGMPSWFFYSCVLGYPVLTLLLWVVIRLAFSHMPLDARVNEEQGGQIQIDGNMSLDDHMNDGKVGQSPENTASSSGSQGGN